MHRWRRLHRLTIHLCKIYSSRYTNYLIICDLRRCFYRNKKKTTPESMQFNVFINNLESNISRLNHGEFNKTIVRRYICWKMTRKCRKRRHHWSGPTIVPFLMSRWCLAFHRTWCIRFRFDWPSLMLAMIWVPIMGIHQRRHRHRLIVPPQQLVMLLWAQMQPAKDWDIGIKCCHRYVNRLQCGMRLDNQQRQKAKVASK